MKTKNVSPLSSKPSAAKKSNATAKSKSTVTIYLTKTVKDEASKLAQIRGITLSELIEQIFFKEKAKSRSDEEVCRA
jgi:macrodomain Ter protein organizer (MatP/YcbG family)